jgi:hypothetical protein
MRTLSNSLTLNVFNRQITTLKYEGTTHVDEDLYSLACRPDPRVRSYTSCIINGVRYNTLARDEHRKTQNSTIKSGGTHGDHTIDFYGTIHDIIELTYNRNSKGRRTVVLLRCEWYNLEGRTYQMKNDGYFKSININGRWYKDDPFILATDASQVFLLEDTMFGPSWRVVREFGHRHIFDVEESKTNEPIQEQVQMRCQEAYQEEHISAIYGLVGDIDPNLDLLHMDSEPGSPISRDLVESLRRQKHTTQGHESVEGDEDEDETYLEYHSPGEDGNTSEEDSDYD